MFREAFDEIKNADVPLGIAQDRIELLKLKKADVTMMILNGFLLELGAFLGVQAKTVVVVVVFGAELLDLMLEMFQERFVAIGLLAVGSSAGVHLEQAEVNPKLNFLFAVFPFKFANHDLPGLVIPRFEQVRNVEIHRCRN